MHLCTILSTSKKGLNYLRTYSYVSKVSLTRVHALGAEVSASEGYVWEERGDSAQHFVIILLFDLGWKTNGIIQLYNTSNITHEDSIYDRP